MGVTLLPEGPVYFENTKFITNNTILKIKDLAAKINRPFGQEGYTHTKGVAFRNKKLDHEKMYLKLLTNLVH